jgi:ribonuclease-3
LGERHTDAFEQYAARLGHEFVDHALLEQALRHRSWCAEHPGHASNERLEFLGDAVLGLVVASFLFDRFPDLPEGRLTELRKRVVSTTPLAELGESLGVGEVLALGRGEHLSGGASKPSLLENAVEASFGAVFVDAGFDAANAVVLRHLGDDLELAAAGPDFDHKSRLHEFAGKRWHKAPRYMHDLSGPDHARAFHATVFIGDEALGEGDGTTKKQAEQEAAGQALRRLRSADESEPRDA